MFEYLCILCMYRAVSPPLPGNGAHVRFRRTALMTFGAKHCLLKGKRGKTDAPIVRLKLKQMRGLSKPCLRQCVSRHAYILRPLRSKACIDFSYSVGSSLFRILHRTTW